MPNLEPLLTCRNIRALITEKKPENPHFMKISYLKILTGHSLRKPHIMYLQATCTPTLICQSKGTPLPRDYHNE